MDSDDSAQWVACLVRPLTDHLAALGNPSWYARFAAQVDDRSRLLQHVVKDALSSPSLVQVVEGINRCIADLPDDVRDERNLMARNLLMHTAPIVNGRWPQALRHRDVLGGGRNAA